MPGGALVQLVAQGGQEQVLYGKPSLTYFQTTLKQPTPFALEDSQIMFSGAVDFNQRLTAQIPRTGDMLHRMSFVAELPELNVTSGTVCWAREIGLVMLREIKFIVGGSTIDSCWGISMSLYSELTIESGHEENYNILIGNTSTLTTPALHIPAAKISVPLQFAFCTTSGLSLPIVALQYHIVSLELNLRPIGECIILSNTAVLSSTPSLSTANLLGEFVYLDVKERNMLAQQPYQSVITVTNYQGAESWSNNSIKSRLAFNHPTKFLLVAIQPTANTDNGANRWTDFSDGTTPYQGGHPLNTMKLTLNGTDRADEQDAMYYNNLVPLRFFSRAPSVGNYVYAFGLKDSINPQGTLNLSRIDQAILQIRTNIPNNTPVVLHVFQWAFNIFRVRSGMGGLMFNS